MSDKTLEKFLSLILRHRPDVVGVTLDAAGWVHVPTLVQALRKNDVRYAQLTPLVLYVVLHESDKKRFETEERADGTYVRACQGHSVPVDLGLLPLEPPTVLFHGTPKENVIPIKTDGIKAGTRHAVHLSADISTALKVGSRRGKPVVFSIDALRMHRNGHTFYRSTNGVWLTAYVPPTYLLLADDIEGFLA